MFSKHLGCKLKNYYVEKIFSYNFVYYNFDMEGNERARYAANFINNTATHVFLTGKAGTGKTTFLQQLATYCHKQFVIVAPTGIAALNAGGVTIHSQFSLPKGSFLPENDDSKVLKLEAVFFTANLLRQKHPMSTQKLAVLRKIELLIIDEVSMLRADILDAIDTRLKYAKKRYTEPFGGVQLLLIGDLFQLPPITKENEWQTLSKYYRSIHFFESKALQKAGFVFVEFDKIYRQKDDLFINLLNNLRQNCITQSDIETLNQYYHPNPKPKPGIITLTTHNNDADLINAKALKALNGKSTIFNAEIDGDFPENMYPLNPTLELKENAQIMFVKNDNFERRFFNGQIGKILKIKDTEIEVITNQPDAEPFWLGKEIWENKKYVINKTTKELEVQVVGTYCHFPIKLSWAITVHKSQGLTFENAILDIGRSFAPGQAYVALSRLKSLDGLILKNPIKQLGIENDKQVVGFVQNYNIPEALPQMLANSQYLFVQKILFDAFNFQQIMEHLLDYEKYNGHSSSNFEDEQLRNFIPISKNIFSDAFKHASKFQKELASLTSQNQNDLLFERLRKGEVYFLQLLWEQLLQVMIQEQYIKLLKKQQTYSEFLSSLNEQIVDSIFLISKLTYTVKAIFNNETVKIQHTIAKENKQKYFQTLEKAKQFIVANPLKSTNKTGKKKTDSSKTLSQSTNNEGQLPSKSNPKTFELTFRLWQEGLSINQIAAERGITVSTVNGHLTKAIEQGKIDARLLMPLPDFTSIAQKMMDEGLEGGLKPIFEHFKEEFSYDSLRFVKAQLLYEQKDY